MLVADLLSVIYHLLDVVDRASFAQTCSAVSAVSSGFARDFYAATGYMRTVTSTNTIPYLRKCSADMLSAMKHEFEIIETVATSRRLSNIIFKVDPAVYRVKFIIVSVHGGRPRDKPLSGECWNSQLLDQYGEILGVNTTKKCAVIRRDGIISIVCLL